MISFVIITYYAVILAWALRYMFFSLNEAWGEDTLGFFVGDFLRVGPEKFSAEIVPGIFWPLIGLWIVAAIVMALGISGGLERVNKVLMPLLIVIFLILVVRALMPPGASTG